MQALFIAYIPCVEKKCFAFAGDRLWLPFEQEVQMADRVLRQGILRKLPPSILRLRMGQPQLFGDREGLCFPCPALINPHAAGQAPTHDYIEKSILEATISKGSRQP